MRLGVGLILQAHPAKSKTLLHLILQNASMCELLYLCTRGCNNLFRSHIKNIHRWLTVGGNTLVGLVSASCCKPKQIVGLGKFCDSVKQNSAKLSCKFEKCCLTSHSCKPLQLASPHPNQIIPYATKTYRFMLTARLPNSLFVQIQLVASSVYWC